MPATQIIVAHRGLHLHAPENSLAAFTAAVEAKIPWVECDVWPSADGVPVVIHDKTLNRMTTGKGEVARHPWSELKKLGLASLPDLLPVLKGTGVLVEIKPANAGAFVDRIVNMLNTHEGPRMIQSFHLENVQRVPRSIPTAYLIEDPQALRIEWPWIHVEHQLIDSKLVDAVRAAGLKIGAWTVNLDADIQRMVDLDIDMLITDDPVLAAKIISKR